MTMKNKNTCPVCFRVYGRKNLRRSRDHILPQCEGYIRDVLECGSANIKINHVHRVQHLTRHSISLCCDGCMCTRCCSKSKHARVQGFGTMGKESAWLNQKPPRSLRLPLWAELDTEINPAGVIDHSQAMPIITEWLREKSIEIAMAVQRDKLRNVVGD